MKKKYYTNFDSYLFRTPLLSYELKNDMSELLEKDYFNEALFLASPELVRQKESHGNHYRMKRTLYKYFSRSFSRCTPFGLFAGCSIGTFGDNLDVRLQPLEQYTRFTRLDMNYICALIQNIERDIQIKYKLKYFPNDTIYELGGKMRYVEYYYKGVKRIHSMISVENNEYVKIILDESRSGATITQLASMIVKDEITMNDAEEFIEELIKSQLLKSELEPLVTGADPLDRLINQMEIIADAKYLPTLIKIRMLLRKIDRVSIGKSGGVYEELIKLIKSMSVDFDLKYLFQTDMFKPIETATLSEDFINDVNDLFGFLNTFTEKKKPINLNKFKDEFVSRYEEQEVSLIQVLDRELGLGYPITEEGVGDINPLIDDLVLPKIRNADRHSIDSPISDLVLRRSLKALALGQDSVILEDNDIQKKSDIRWDDLPETLALMCTIVKGAFGDCKIVLKSIGGASAANLMGRFSHVHPMVDNLVKQITEKEQRLYGDVILAEIAHLPESRIGNIALRPKLRDYEIKYLSNSCFELEKQILVSDILISIKKNRIVLRSKKLNREIIPYLTNAHNYSYNSLPVYHFLCDMQRERKRDGLHLNFGRLFEHFEHVPRIQYKNFILSLQKWNLQEDWEGLNKLSDSELIENIHVLRNKYRICQEVTFGEGDHELYVDLENVLSIRTFLSRVKNQTKLTLSEFIFGSFRSSVTGENSQYANEFIIPLYKTI